MTSNRAVDLPRQPLAPALLLSSCGTLGFELLLTRVFGIALGHHFAAMVVTIAMLGLAASGVALAAFERVRGALPPPRAAHFLLLSGAIATTHLAAIRIPFDPARLSFDPWHLSHLGIACAVLAVPFFIAGVILASALAARGERAGVLYGADLVGAALGSLSAVLLQRFLSPGQAVLVFAAVPLGGAYLLGRPRMRLLVAALAMPLLAVAALRPAWVEMRIAPSRELSQLLQPAEARRLQTIDSPYGRVDVFRSPGVRYAPGLSLRFRGELPAQVGLAIDGGSVTTATLSGGAADRGFVEYLPAALPFALRPGANAMLIDPQGGLPWLIAQQLGARRVDCSESNPALARAVLGLLGPGRAPCGGRIAPGLGRNVLRRRPGRYDVIDLSLTGSLPIGTSGAGEDYALTVEAFEDYLAGLAPEGILSVNLYLHPPYRSELRLFGLVIDALGRTGAAAPRHVAAVRSLETLSLLVKRTPFTAAELDAVRGFAAERWFDPAWPLELAPEKDDAFVRTGGLDLAGAFAALADPGRREAFTRGYLFDISAVTDERPFFHFSLRLDHVREIYELVQRRWDFFIHEGYLAPAVLLQVGLLGLLVLAVPALLIRGGATGCGRARAIGYFAALGAGYLCVEIALLQRLILALEHPLTAASLVIGTILVGSGLGSLAGQRVARPVPAAAALAVALAAGAAALLLAPLVAAISGWPAPARIPAAVAIVLPLGFLMGVPFPWGIRALHATAPRLVPWAWAVNGYCSVLAPLAAALLATRIGFSGVLGVGAALYAAAALVGRPLGAPSQKYCPAQEDTSS